MTALMTGRNAMDIMSVAPREGDSESAEEATLDDYFCNEMDATDSCCHWKGQDDVG
jgi:hypothetical protein